MAITSQFDIVWRCRWTQILVVQVSLGNNRGAWSQQIDFTACQAVTFEILWEFICVVAQASTQMRAIRWLHIACQLRQMTLGAFFIELEKVRLIGALYGIDLDQLLHYLRIRSQLAQKVFFGHDHSIVVDRW